MSFNNKEYLQWKKNKKNKRTLLGICIGILGIGGGLTAGWAIWNSAKDADSTPSISNTKVVVTEVGGNNILNQKISTLTLNAELLNPKGGTTIYYSENRDKNITTGDTLLDNPKIHCYGWKVEINHSEKDTGTIEIKLSYDNINDTDTANHDFFIKVKNNDAVGVSGQIHSSVISKNDRGTDWGHDGVAGEISGNVVLGEWIPPESGEEYGTCSIMINNQYTAKDLVIPELIYHEADEDGPTGTYRIIGIKQSAFDVDEGSVLTGSLTISDSVETIDQWAFYGCSNLTSLTINSAASIGWQSFCACSQLNSIIWNSVTSIGWRAFTGSALTNITIPDSVTSIAGEAFAACEELTDVTIPSSVNTMQGAIFSECFNLTSITLSGFTSESTPTNWEKFNPEYPTSFPGAFGKIGNSNGIVSVDAQGTIDASQAKAILVACGLPDEWNPPTL